VGRYGSKGDAASLRCARSPFGLRSRLRYPEPELDWTRTRPKGTAGRAEAQVTAPAPGRVPATVRRPAKQRPVAPAPAPDHPVRAHQRSIRQIRIVLVVPILAPLEHVPQDITQAPAVAMSVIGRCGSSLLATRVALLPAIVLLRPRPFVVRIRRQRLMHPVAPVARRPRSRIGRMACQFPGIPGRDGRHAPPGSVAPFSPPPHHRRHRPHLLPPRVHPFELGQYAGDLANVIGGLRQVVGRPSQSAFRFAGQIIVVATGADRNR
jgi:hypothetical protein